MVVSVLIAPVGHNLAVVAAAAAALQKYTPLTWPQQIKGVDYRRGIDGGRFRGHHSFLFVFFFQ